MSFYEKRILPHVINCACGAPAVARQRQKVVPKASGRVLELGIGTGLNAEYAKTVRTLARGVLSAEGRRDSNAIVHMVS